MLGKLLFRYLKPYSWLLLGVLVFQFASAIASLYLPSLNADIIDNGVAKGDTEYIWSTGIVDARHLARCRSSRAIIATLLRREGRDGAPAATSATTSSTR